MASIDLTAALASLDEEKKKLSDDLNASRRQAEALSREVEYVT